MRPWATWLIRHRLKWVLMLLWFLSSPLYLLAYAGDAYRDWRLDGEAISKAMEVRNERVN